MGDARARLFVALELPEPVRDALMRWRARMGPARPGALRQVARESLHVTLCFLGSRPEDEIDAIAAACAIVAAESAPELVLAEGLWLPPRRPRVLAARLEDHERGLARIQSELSATLAAGGWYEPDKRPFLAHVTVARVGASLGPRPPELPEPPRVEFTGSSVVLYRSRLSRSGARYEPLSRVSLATSTA